MLPVVLLRNVRSTEHPPNVGWTMVVGNKMIIIIIILFIIIIIFSVRPSYL